MTRAEEWVYEVNTRMGGKERRLGENKERERINVIREME
jgi:hypothetical protein